MAAPKRARPRFCALKREFATIRIQARDASDTGQVDEQGAPRAEKAAVQHAFDFLERHLKAVFPRRVHGDVVQPAFHIADFIKGNAHGFALAGDEQRALVAAEVLHRAIQHGKELLARDGLEQVVQGLYVVAVGNVIRITGEEHDGDFPVLRAHRSRQRHAVHARHFDVQQQKVEGFVLLVLDEERFRRGERFDARGMLRLFRPGLRQQAGVL